MLEFVELHQHGEDSALDGKATIKEIVSRARELRQPAVALTDHGNMQGFWDLYKEGKEQGVKPIIGNEVYITDDRFLKEKGAKHFHLVLLAKNKTGLKNLFKMTTKSHLEGFYKKPRIDWDLLQQHHEGVICISACLAGYPQQLIIDKNYLQAKKIIKKFKKIFGDDFYLEVQPNHHAPQKDVNKAFSEWHEGMGIDLVATTDAHYMSLDDRTNHMVFTKIGGFDGEETYKYNYNMSGDEVVKNLVELTDMNEDKAIEAVKNTVNIADKVEDYDIDTSLKLPPFEIPTEYDSDNEYLKQLCRDGWIKRGINLHSKAEQKVYVDRLMEEFEVIFNKGFSSYFLIVQDFINWSRRNGIVVGYGRGSAGGSLVAYLTGIVELDPVEYDLLFERFLNPDRNDLPDIDVDMADRNAVVQYVKEKYGAEKVANVITFGTFGAKGVVRDVAKALFGKSKGGLLGSKISNLIPDTPGIKLQKAIDESEDLQELIKQHDIKQIIDYAFEFEGRKRHTSTHACALIIADRDLTEVLPLMNGSGGEKMTMIDMDSCEELGLVKFDFLGLQTLSIIQNTADLINDEREGA